MTQFDSARLGLTRFDSGVTFKRNLPPQPAKTSTDISDEQQEDGGADDEASSSPAPKESTGGSSTPLGIATPLEEEHDEEEDLRRRRQPSERHEVANGRGGSSRDNIQCVRTIYQKATYV